MMECTISDRVIQLNSGRYINILDPDMNAVNIHDISRALANTGRFGGHAKQFYSVAQHSVLGSYKAINGVEAFAFMTHDMSEAYLMDVPTPLKNHLSDYKKIEEMWERRLSGLFRVAYPYSDGVHRLDLEALATEKRDLIQAEDTWEVLDGVQEWPERINVWHPIYANYRFLKRMKELGDGTTGKVNVPSPILPIIVQAFQSIVNIFI